MSAQLVTFIAWLGGLLIGLGVGFRWGYSQRKEATPAAEPIDVRVLRDIDSVPMGSLMVITYPDFLNKEQRAAIKAIVEEKIADRMKVMILEGGMKATVITENRMDIQPSSPWPKK